jgi:hypothetical protein
MSNLEFKLKYISSTNNNLTSWGKMIVNINIIRLSLKIIMNYGMIPIYAFGQKLDVTSYMRSLTCLTSIVLFINRKKA